MRFGTDKLILGQKHERKRGGDVNLHSQGTALGRTRRKIEVHFYKHLRYVHTTLGDEE